MRPRALRRARLALGTALACALALTATTAVQAAYTATTTNPGASVGVGSVAVTDDGAAPPSITGGALGASDARCTTVTSTGTLASELRHYATTSGPLAQYLDVRVTKGHKDPAAVGCTGFVPDATNYRGAGAGVVYDGALTGLGTAWSDGVPDPAGPGGLGGGYAAAVAAAPGLVNHWRLGDAVVEDSFSGAAGAPLQSRAGEAGASWSRHPAAAARGTTADAVLTATGRLRRSGPGGAWYLASGVPATADHAVVADLHVASVLPGDEAGVQARVDPASRTYYQLSHRTAADWAGWELTRVVGGTASVLDRYAETLAAGRAHRLRLQLQGSTVTGTVDGVERVSATDAAITAAGRAGIQLGVSGPAVGGDGDGLQLDDVRVIDASAPAVFRDAQGGAPGTWSRSPTRVAGALGGDDDLAVRLDGVDDRGTAARQVSDDFTLAFWFRSTRGAGTGGEWHQAAPLVDADVAGPAKDFGVGLLADGRVLAGVGGAVETTAATTARYDDGHWHHVAFTRVRASGALALYLDGRLADAVTAPGRESLSDPTSIALGSRTALPALHLAGELDEVSTHDVALDAAQVADLAASAGTGTEVWTAGESHTYEISVRIRQDPAARGQSGTASFAWEARSR